MTRFVMALLIIQLMLGGYLFAFVLTAGVQRDRTTRLPDPVVLGHGFLALAATALWAIHLAGKGDGFAWASFAALLATASGGLFMAWRTRKGGPTARSRETGAPAIVVEKQIPSVAIGTHGVIALMLLVCSFLGASGLA